MNVMANQTATALESLKVYTVTKSWFLRAWPILTAKPPNYVTDDFGDNLREYIGKINNSELVLVDTTESNQISIDNDNDNGVKEQDGGIHSDGLVDGKAATTITKSNGVRNHLEFHRSIPENPETTKMKPGLVHTKDYFFLGTSAWLLVKEKFGYDGYEICRSCKNVVTGNFGQGVIAVALLPGEETVPLSTDDEQTKILQSTVLPVSGRFQYEKVIPSKLDSDVCMNSTSHNNRVGIKSEVSVKFSIQFYNNRASTSSYRQSVCIENMYAMLNIQLNSLLCGLTYHVSNIAPLDRSKGGKG